MRKLPYDINKLLELLEPYRGDSIEHMFTVMLDDDYSIVHIEEVGITTENDRVEFEEHKLFQPCWKYNCNKVIFVHNHPSGRCRASLADKMFTYKIYNECKGTMYKLIDDVVITKDDYYSPRELGNLTKHWSIY